MKTLMIQDKQNQLTIDFNLPESDAERLMGNIKIVSFDSQISSITRVYREIIACQKVDEMYVKTDFAVICDANIITISGNLFNAFNMMDERGTLSPDVIQQLKFKEGFIRGLELTKREVPTTAKSSSPFFAPQKQPAEITNNTEIISTLLQLFGIKINPNQVANVELHILTVEGANLNTKISGMQQNLETPFKGW